MVVIIILHHPSQLVQVLFPFAVAGLFERVGEIGNYHCREDCHNSNDDKKFYEGKTMILSRVAGGGWCFVGGHLRILWRKRKCFST